MLLHPTTKSRFGRSSSGKKSRSRRWSGTLCAKAGTNRQVCVRGRRRRTMGGGSTNIAGVDPRQELPAGVGPYCDISGDWSGGRARAVLRRCDCRKRFSSNRADGSLDAEAGPVTEFKFCQCVSLVARHDVRTFDLLRKDFYWARCCQEVMIGYK